MASDHHVGCELLQGVVGASTLHTLQNLGFAGLELPGVAGPVLVPVAVVGGELQVRVLLRREGVGERPRRGVRGARPVHIKHAFLGWSDHF